MRLYRIRNKKTNLFISHVELLREGKKDRPRVYGLKFYAYTRHLPIDELNMLVEQIIRFNLSSYLDDCEIITYEPREPVEVKGGIKLPTLRNRLEQKEIMRRLKSE